MIGFVSEQIIKSNNLVQSIEEFIIITYTQQFSQLMIYAKLVLEKEQWNSWRALVAAQ